MVTDERAVEQTKKWVNDVVVGCNFCPFAAHVIKQQRVRYSVQQSEDAAICLESFLAEAIRMDDDASTETSLIIFPNACNLFADYLDMVSVAEKILTQQGYDGIYQVASFHPQYCFAGSDENDAANYTNRSIYPMLHLIREESIDKALASYKNPDDIPAANINFAQQKGLLFMQLLRQACM